MTNFFKWLQVRSQIALEAMFWGLVKLQRFVGRVLMAPFEDKEFKEFMLRMDLEDRRWSCWQRIDEQLKADNNHYGRNIMFSFLHKDGELLAMAESTLDAFNWIKGRYSCPYAPVNMVNGLFFSDKHTHMISQAEALFTLLNTDITNYAENTLYVDRYWFDRVNYIGVVRGTNLDGKGVTVFAHLISRGVTKASDTITDAFSLMAYFEQCREAVSRVYYNTPRRDERMARIDRQRGAEDGAGIRRPDDSP